MTEQFQFNNLSLNVPQYKCYANPWEIYDENPEAFPSEYLNPDIIIAEIEKISETKQDYVTKQDAIDSIIYSSFSQLLRNTTTMTIDNEKKVINYLFTKYPDAFRKSVGEAIGRGDGGEVYDDLRYFYYDMDLPREELNRELKECEVPTNDHIEILCKVLNPSYTIDDLNNGDDFEYIQCEILSDYLSETDDFTGEEDEIVIEKLKKFLNKFLPAVPASDIDLRCICNSDKLFTYYIDTFTQRRLDIIDYFTHHADGVEDFIYIVEYLVKHNITISEELKDDYHETVLKYLNKPNYFEFDGYTLEQIKKYFMKKNDFDALGKNI
jgi:hypothetical protein